MFICHISSFWIHFYDNFSSILYIFFLLPQFSLIIYSIFVRFLCKMSIRDHNYVLEIYFHSIFKFLLMMTELMAHILMLLNRGCGGRVVQTTGIVWRMRSVTEFGSFWLGITTTGTLLGWSDSKMNPPPERKANEVKSRMVVNYAGEVTKIENLMISYHFHIFYSNK